MTPDDKLNALYAASVEACRQALANHERLPPMLLGVSADGLHLLRYDVIDARQHLYMMRAAFKQDALAGLVYASLGTVKFTDAVGRALVSVLATPTRIVAEAREVTEDGRLLDRLTAPQAVVMAYEDVFTDVPLPTIRKTPNPLAAPLAFKPPK